MKPTLIGEYKKSTSITLKKDNTAAVDAQD